MIISCFHRLLDERRSPSKFVHKVKFESRESIMHAEQVGITIVLLAGLSVAVSSAAAMQCEDALFLDTYKSNKSYARDWRLARYVSKSQWEQAHNSGGANAVIYGVPVGGSYDDFRSRIDRLVEKSNESLTEEERENIMWAGVSDNTSGNYRHCLDSEVFVHRGLHAMVVSAQANDLTIRMKWDNTPPTTVNLDWGSFVPAEVRNALPTTMEPGEHSFVVPRPKQQYTLVANAQGGWTSEPIAIVPLPPPPVMPNLCTGTTSSSGMAVDIPRDTLCRQTVTYEGYGRFKKGCGASSESADIRRTGSSGSQVLVSWHDGNFDNAVYSGLAGSTVVAPGETARIELVRTESHCSNPNGAIGMNVSITKSP